MLLYLAGTLDSVLVSEVSSCRGSFVLLYLAGTLDRVLVSEVSSGYPHRGVPL